VKVGGATDVMLRDEYNWMRQTDRQRDRQTERVPLGGYVCWP